MTSPSGVHPYADLIRARVEDSIRTKEAILPQVDHLAQIAEVIVNAYRQGNKLVLFGNGGSAADAQHIATEMVGRYYLERPALPAEALTVNTSSLTAIGNDYAFERVFARQIEAAGRPGDVAIGISTSGNSANVIQGVLKAREMGLVTVGLSGQDGGRLKDLVDHCVCIPSQDTPRIQEGHILVGHILCEIVERQMFGQAAP